MTNKMIKNLNISQEKENFEEQLEIAKQLYLKEINEIRQSNETDLLKSQQIIGMVFGRNDLSSLFLFSH